MKGYCSNSPLKCSYARSCEIIEAHEHCPKCRLALIEANRRADNVKQTKGLLLNIFMIISALGLCLSILFLSYNS